MLDVVVFARIARLSSSTLRQQSTFGKVRRKEATKF
jgi:hypothetical protein